MSVAIVIPVYKKSMSADERASLVQGVRILKKYDMYFVCPETLDLHEYTEVAPAQIKEKRFPSEYFKSIEGYNRLMKTQHFYAGFKNYDYILIYQLDAWVFADELETWCQKGYDYVGAPWFENFKSHEDGCRLWQVGNGGLSLRKVSAFIKVTNQLLRIKTAKEIFSEEYHSLKDLGHCLVRCCSPLIGNNTMRHFMSHGPASWLWEDSFFCVGLADTRHRLNTPSPEDAAFFAFEQSPRFLYDTITHGQLPFGCHAWRKNQYEAFWQTFIDVKSDAIET